MTGEVIPFLFERQQSRLQKIERERDKCLAHMVDVKIQIYKNFRELIPTFIKQQPPCMVAVVL